MGSTVQNPSLADRLYPQMALIRAFEERVFQLFSEGELFGTTHGYIGQEANAVALLDHLVDQDIVVSNHRCHGHYLARTDDVEGLMAEMMGRERGVSGGRGGSQHLHRGNFFSHGILGGNAPVAERGYLIGSAERLESTASIKRCFGDDVGTTYFAHDVPAGREDEHWDILSVFSIDKTGRLDAGSHPSTDVEPA